MPFSNLPARTKQTLVIGGIMWVLALVSLVFAYQYGAFNPSGQKNSGINTSSGIGGEFSLISHTGETVTDKTFSGAPFMVFFGFTHCPDVCPTALFEMSEALRATGEKGEKLRALYITVDPERDTTDVLKNYMSSFDPRVIGLTGSPEAIQNVARAYRAYYKKVPTKESYTMDHSAAVYLMDKNGQFLRVIDLKRPPETVAKELLAVL